MSPRPLVYISYSHKDRAFADELLKFLRPLEQTADFQVWHDRKLLAGTDLEKQIIEALDEAAIAVLLVSADYLASEWIIDKELPRLFRRQQLGEVSLLPIIVRPAPWVHTQLAYLQVLPRNGRALSELHIAERDRVWTELTEVLVAALHRFEELSAKSPVKQVDREPEFVEPKSREAEDKMVDPSRNKEPEGEGLFFISHAKEDGDFAENLKSHMSEAGFTGWIDIDVLEAGTDWRKEIDEAILSSRAVILILSPDSKASEYVTYEWAFGLGTGLRVVPLLIRDTPIHPRLEAFQYLDFTNRRARPWNRLYALLRELSVTEAEA